MTRKTYTPIAGTTSWPDTTATPAPAPDPPYAAAVWLLGRHPQLAELADQLGVVTTTDEDAVRRLVPSVDLTAIAEAFAQTDARRASYRDEFGAFGPGSDAEMDRWEATQPKLSPAAEALVVMSQMAKARLRLLATLSMPGVRFSAGDLAGFDRDGQALLADWCRVIEQS